ncbi:hypothetical protein [Agaribacter flavus]|uniref:Lipoprotein n=1 Tax=Agaribacter flavus TaxID=1902781 RepID=A0ABV7FUV7_9ALTE
MEKVSYILIIGMSYFLASCNEDVGESKCKFAYIDKGWREVTVIPDELSKTRYFEEGNFYFDSNGDIVKCLHSDSDGICNGNYIVFSKNVDGIYEEYMDIICVD